jgi:hypothetical protein
MGLPGESPMVSRPGRAERPAHGRSGPGVAFENASAHSGCLRDGTLTLPSPRIMASVAQARKLAAQPTRTYSPRIPALAPMQAKPGAVAV